MAIYTLDQFLGSFTVMPLGWSAQGALQLPQQTQPWVPTGTSWAQGHWPHLAANQLNIHTWPLFLGLSGAGEGSTVGVFIIFILVSGISVYKYTFFLFASPGCPASWVRAVPLCAVPKFLGFWPQKDKGPARFAQRQTEDQPNSLIKLRENDPSSSASVDKFKYG